MIIIIDITATDIAYMYSQVLNSCLPICSQTSYSESKFLAAILSGDKVIVHINQRQIIGIYFLP